MNLPVNSQKIGDMASIRRLIGEEATITGMTCPSCDMPFDKGKKRRLIDNCGHERCYSCMFYNEVCPLCFVNNQEDEIDGIITSPNNINLKGSQITLYGEITPQYLRTDEKIPCRTRVKTNGHFTTPTQKKQEHISSVHPEKLPKTRPSNSRFRTDQNVMVQSCPTPPQSRRKFFLSPKALRNSITQSQSERQSVESTMSASTELRNWRSVVLGKIKSLWSTGASHASAGLNQLLSDDGTEGSNPRVAKKNSDSDMYMRLGLLLGDSAQRNKGNMKHHDSNHSLHGYEVISSNTSPLSTLTGSSEDQHRMNPYSESTSSIMSMSMSGHSNCSSSPVGRRRYIPVQAQVEDRTPRKNFFKRTAKSPNEISFPQYKPPQLTLKPLFFEVPLQEPDPLFIGRHWLIKEIEDVLVSTNPGILLTGNPGTGKTAFILQLVQYSCFGRRKDHFHISANQNMNTIESSVCPQSIYYQIDLVMERIKQLSNSVVAYHFCQADNNNTCLVPDFIHSLAAQLCQAPQLAAYRDHLLSEQHLQSALSLKECIANPDVALVRGILEPLTNLEKSGKIKNVNYIILIDALCEAEYHRPDHGDTITTFLMKHIPSFPSWLKVLATIRTQLQDIAKHLPYSRISLDSCNENIQKDMLNYINFRLQNSPSIQNNIIASTSGKLESESVSLHKFSQHLLNLSKGSFLHTKLTLDLLERGHLVAKSSGYKVLPVSLAQIYLLHFNLRFPTIRSFEKVSNILSVCLAALYPLTLLEIYYSVNSLSMENFTTWSDFLQSFKLLSGFLIKRLDNTYMFFHPSFREWLIRRDEHENNKFLCDLRSGHAAIAFRLSRIQAPLDAEKTLELSHHILKAHVYRNIQTADLSSRDLQAFWISDSSSNTSDSICHMRNMYSPNVKVSRLLLLAGASPNSITTFLGNAPILCMYANEGIVPMVSLLLEFGADVELANSQGCTALSLAAAKGHCDIVKHLIAAGARPGHPDTAGNCSLVHAARNGYLNVVSYLIACDWSLDSIDVQLAEAAQQALIAAAGQDHLEIVEFLLDMAEVGIDVPDTITGETALTIAATNGCNDACSVLIARGARLNIPNKRMLAPLHLCVKEGHWAIAEKLLQHQASIEQADKTGKTALMYAASEGFVGLIELLLDKGANIHKEDSDGLTAFCWALLRGRQLAVQCLIERGAKINHTDKMGRTPLDLAAYQGNSTTVQLLLDKGAIIEHVDINGMRPLDRAIGCRNVQVIHCFLKKGAKLGPATWAMAAGKPEIILILLNKLLEDGNILYRKNRLREAAHRYQYALKKFPPDEQGGNTQAFNQLRINFLLNYSRCRRKLNETDEAIELANEVLSMKPESYEAYYARAKAYLSLSNYEQALKDVKEALKLSPLQNMQIRKVLVYLRDEINSKLNNPGQLPKKDFTVSVDVLNE
ncbi:protein TANC2 isoform X3 [Coccinella septempunctata]|uniref:protein TANC2 isoform X3 n=1 Tax=Coccinella septempunctata TaxID=41139 RepID=UPI001D06DDBA|nr:protein TANC2 isoform X3 [Coccinella septempunctata]